MAKKIKFNFFAIKQKKICYKVLQTKQIKFIHPKINVKVKSPNRQSS
jgi:hypothetical protein